MPIREGNDRKALCEAPLIEWENRRKGQREKKKKKKEKEKEKKEQNNNLEVIKIIYFFTK